MPTHHLDFHASHDPEVNSTTIRWTLRRTGLRAGTFYDEVLDDGRTEVLWEDHHDVSVRCAFQKAMGHFQARAQLCEPF